MDWWILELITIGVLIVIVAVLGPLIKRFGKAYAADVFRANPRTGKVAFMQALQATSRFEIGNRRLQLLADNNQLLAELVTAD
jgi:hypothetical protein